MTPPDSVLADRLNVLQEILSLSLAFDLIEHRDGSHALIDDTRLRLQRVRMTVLGQVCALMDAGHTATVH